MFAAYDEALAGIPGVGFQPVAPWADAAPWLYCITVDERAFGRSRDELMQDLAGSGIETRPFFVPIHRLPPYVRPGEPESLPVTDVLGSSGMNLPTATQMTEGDVERIADAIRAARR